MLDHVFQQSEEINQDQTPKRASDCFQTKAMALQQYQKAIREHKAVRTRSPREKVETIHYLYDYFGNLLIDVRKKYWSI